jgi:DNA-binding response OmpR family regulator
MEPSTKTTVLIVEDSTELSDVLMLAFSQKGYEVIVAHSYTEACTYLDAHVPDALVCDLMLGEGKGGIDVLAYVRGAPRLADLLCVVMTDSTSFEHIAEAADARVLLYIQKAETDPFQIAEKVDALLRVR